MNKTELRLTSTQEMDETTMYNFDIIANDQVVGCVQLNAESEDDEHAYVERIDIDEEFRNNGYGTDALMQLSDKCYGIEIAPDNEDARRLYERIGEESNWDAADYIDQGYGVYRI